MWYYYKETNYLDREESQTDSHTYGQYFSQRLKAKKKGHFCLINGVGITTNAYAKKEGMHDSYFMQN